MTDRFLTHDTMVLERTYSASVDRVFHAWSDPAIKRIWFLGGEPQDSSSGDYELDFRVGGHEVSRGGAPGSDEIYTYDAEFRDIVPNGRIVYTNYMLRRETRISVSLTTVEFVPDGDGTRLVLTEHGVYLDGEDKPEYRTEGIGTQLDALGAVLEREATADIRA